MSRLSSVQSTFPLKVLINAKIENVLLELFLALTCPVVSGSQTFLQPCILPRYNLKYSIYASLSCTATLWNAVVSEPLHRSSALETCRMHLPFPLGTIAPPSPPSLRLPSALQFAQVLCTKLQCFVTCYRCHSLISPAESEGCVSQVERLRPASRLGARLRCTHLHIPSHRSSREHLHFSD